MDDALVPPKKEHHEEPAKVLILVVMDDALVLKEMSQKELTKSLNPCCNG